MNMDDVVMRFDKRIAEKKAEQPLPTRYSAVVYFDILAHSYEQADETHKIVCAHLNKFDDLNNAQGEVM